MDTHLAKYVTSNSFISTFLQLYLFKILYMYIFMNMDIILLYLSMIHNYLYYYDFNCTNYFDNKYAGNSFTFAATDSWTSKGTKLSFMYACMYVHYYCYYRYFLLILLILSYLLLMISLRLLFCL